MSQGEEKNVLLSSLEEIKKGSEEDVPNEPQAPLPEAPRPQSQTSALGGGLLNSLLDEVKAEADREVEEITRTLEQRSALEKEQREEEERKKKEQYDKLIQDEARRRLQVIKRKEDERKRKAADEDFRAQRQEQMRVEKERQQKRRRFLLVASGVAGVATAAVVVLVLTGVIPLLEPSETPAGQEPAKTAPSVAQNTEKKAEQEYTGPIITEPDPEKVYTTIDGPAAAVLAIPEHSDIESLRVVDPPVEEVKLAIRTDEMHVRLVRAFARHSSGGGGSSDSGDGGSSGQGGIKIDDSIFKD